MSPTLAGVLAVAGGGALGAVLRHAVVALAAAWFGLAFPWGTLLVNLAGSFAIGWLFVLLPDAPHPLTWLRLALVTGMLGSFTTFSAFSLETLHLLQSGAHARAAAYVFASVALCVAGAWGGLLAGRALHGAG